MKIKHINFNKHKCSIRKQTHPFPCLYCIQIIIIKILIDYNIIVLSMQKVIFYDNFYLICNKLNLNYYIISNFC